MAGRWGGTPGADLLSQSPSIIDTLNLSDAEHDWLGRCFREASGASRSGAARLQGRRQSPRFGLERGAVLVCEVRDAHERARYLVRCCDISSGGISFLHGGYLHAGTPCQLILITEDRRGLRIDGRVLRSEHLRGRVHRVALRFDERLDLEALGPATLAGDESLPLFEQEADRA